MRKKELLQSIGQNYYFTILMNSIYTVQACDYTYAGLKNPPWFRPNFGLKLTDF